MAKQLKPHTVTAREGAYKKSPARLPGMKPHAPAPKHIVGSNKKGMPMASWSSVHPKPKGRGKC